MLLNGCREGKLTPRLVEVKCPKCGQSVEVFVRMDGAPGEAGTLVGDEVCSCGYVLPAGSYRTDYQEEK